jgi:exodeoxyribonuclease V alpha subunit
MIRGIGPVYAKKLVRAFGAVVFDIIQQEPDRLREVTGIGPRRAERIIAGWAEQRVIRKIVLFLHSNGVGTSRGAHLSGLRPRCCWADLGEPISAGSRHPQHRISHG